MEGKRKQKEEMGGGRQGERKGAERRPVEEVALEQRRDHKKA